MHSDGVPVARGRLRKAPVQAGAASSGLRAREISQLFDAVGVGLAEVLPDGRIGRANTRLCSMLGCSCEKLLTLTLQAIMLPDDGPLDIKDAASILPDGISSPPIRRRLIRSDGSLLWTSLTISRSTPTANSYLVTVVDLASFKTTEIDPAECELRQADLEHAKRGELLTWELNHRLRNIFPTILTIMKLTGERYPAAAEYRGALERRLRAIAAAEDLMRRSESNSVSLEGLLNTELLPFQEHADITIDGPSVMLRGAVAQCLTILLHELATNAAKYGALSVQNGRLTVIWQVALHPSGNHRLMLEWLEREGPSIPPSRQAGFGTQIIGQSGELLGGTARADYGPEGLQYHLEFPIRPIS